MPSQIRRTGKLGESPALLAMPTPIQLPRSLQLYIAHLAHRLDAMDAGRARLDPVAYRLWSRRLREALAGCPEPMIVRGLAVTHRSVCEALEQRHFDTFGVLPGARGRAAARVADRLFEGLAPNPG
jgi:hypothetical protein